MKASSSNGSMARVVPTSTDHSVWSSDTAETLQASTPNPTKKRSLYGCKLPGCAYFVAIRRAENFGKVSAMALLCTSFFAITKYMMAKDGEYKVIQNALENTADVLAMNLKLQIESDVSALDNVANLWHLNSNISRAGFRQYILSEFYKPNLRSFETCMLMHRVKPWQREAVETEPSSVQARFDCCNGTKYDDPIQGIRCRDKAKGQCKLPADRFHFVARTADRKLLQAPYDDKDKIIISYSEPLEKNPCPQGLDMCSPGMSGRCHAWLESERTGLKAITKRFVRVFDPDEFCMLVWNPVFVDKARDENKTLFEGVDLMSKKRVIEKGGEPYAIGAVVSAYKPQKMLKNLVKRVFGKGLRNTRVYLLDERSWVADTERLMAVWDAELSEEEMKMEAVRLGHFTKEGLVGESMHQARSFQIDGTGEGTAWSIMVVPNDRFVDELRSRMPLLLLLLSVGLMVVSQTERWMGHPYIVSSSKMIRARIAEEIRRNLQEAKIQAEVEAKVRQELMRKNDSEPFSELDG